MHLTEGTARRVLSDAQKDQFLHEGFVKLANAFPSETAAAARAILWQATGCDPEDRTTWTRPVIRLGDFAEGPFREAVNTEVLHSAFDELAGEGRWVPRASVGGFPIRFPHPGDAGDTGWHVDASFAPEGADELPGRYFDWRVNLRSRGRALLMLLLFSDVGEEDAPTRIRVGSHLPVARLLAPAGEDGLPFIYGTGTGRRTCNGRNGRDHGDWSGRDGLSVSSVSGAFGTAASRSDAAFSCSAAALPQGAHRTHKGRWRLLAG